MGKNTPFIAPSLYAPAKYIDGVDASTSIIYLIMGAKAQINHIKSWCIFSILKLLFLHSSTRKVISTYVDLKSMYRELIIYARRL